MRNQFDVAYLRRYVNGELSSSEMYAIEKASHQDEMLMDLILGLEEEKRLGITADAKDLHAAIYDRSHPNTPVRMFPYKSLGIAASLLLFLGIGTIWYLNRPKESEELDRIAADVANIAAEDSALNSIDLDSIDSGDTSETLIAAIPEMRDPQASELSQSKQVRAREKTEAQKKELSLSPDLFIDTARLVPDQMIANRDSKLAKKRTQLASANNPNVINLQGSMAKVSVAPQAEIMEERLASPQDFKRIITGEVIDRESGYPIPQATVRNIKTNEVVVTDSSGSFVMPTSLESTELEILSIGYQSTRILAKNQQRISLSPEYETLDEVVVSGYSGNKNKTKSEPLVGWKAYKRYINDHTKESLFGKGSVTLIFDISNFGRPIDISLVKSANPSLDQQAVQIIKNGPDWKKGSDGKRIEIKISFK